MFSLKVVVNVRSDHELVTAKERSLFTSWVFALERRKVTLRSSSDSEN